MKTFDEGFLHLYSEKWYHISKRNRQSLITGYHPNEEGRFHFCIRLLDHRDENVDAVPIRAIDERLERYSIQ